MKTLNYLINYWKSHYKVILYYMGLFASVIFMMFLLPFFICCLITKHFVFGFIVVIIGLLVAIPLFNYFADKIK